MQDSSRLLIRNTLMLLYVYNNIYTDEFYGTVLHGGVTLADQIFLPFSYGGCYWNLYPAVREAVHHKEHVHHRFLVFLRAGFASVDAVPPRGYPDGYDGRDSPMSAIQS